MRRREFIGLVGGVAAAWPLGAGAQSERVRKIGMLVGSFEKDDPNTQRELKVFEDTLAAAGWHANRNILIEYRWAGGDIARIMAAAKELVGLGLDIIVTRATPATAETLQLTNKTPVIFVQLADPLGPGFVKSFAKPGTNATGFTNLEASMATKWLGLLEELVPRLPQVTMIYHPETSLDAGRFFSQPLEAAAVASRIKPHIASIRDLTDVEKAVSITAEARGALVVAPGSFLAGRRKEVLNIVAKKGVPAIYPFSYWAREGGLLSYGIDSLNLFRGAASYVDRILRGAQPANLPVQAPTQFDMVINLKTAKSLGLDVPLSLQARADEVIE